MFTRVFLLSAMAAAATAFAPGAMLPTSTSSAPPAQQKTSRRSAPGTWGKSVARGVPIKSPLLMCSVVQGTSRRWARPCSASARRGRVRVPCLLCPPQHLHDFPGCVEILVPTILSSLQPALAPPTPSRTTILSANHACRDARMQESYTQTVLCTTILSANQRPL